jgi:hypothetical protein
MIGCPLLEFLNPGLDCSGFSAVGSKGIGLGFHFRGFLC